MADQRSAGGLFRGVMLTFVLAMYVFALAVWTPLFLAWPRRYPVMTYSQTVATRWGLVRHIWANLERRVP